MRLKWEVDNSEKFRHRIITDVKGVKSEWASYNEIAVLKDEGNVFFAVTAHYKAIFPTEQLLLCKKLKKVD